MKLLRDWHAHNERRPFEWGQWDCCLAAADWWATLTGTHPATDAIGAYSTLGEAVNYRASIADSFVGMITHFVGEPLPNPLMAGTGDVAVVKHGIGHMTGVVIEGSLLIPSKRGLVVVPRKHYVTKGVWRA